MRATTDPARSTEGWGERAAGRRRVREPAGVHQGEPGVRLHRLQALQHPAAGGAADAAGRDPDLRRVPRPPPGRPGRVHPALQHHPHQRHRILPGLRGVAGAAAGDHPQSAGPQDTRREHPGVVGGLRQRRGGVRARDPPGRGGGRRGVPPAGQGLRHRRRRGRPGHRAAGHLRREGDPGGPRGAPGAVLRAHRVALGLPRRPAPQRHLRAQRPRAGRPHRPASTCSCAATR